MSDILLFLATSTKGKRFLAALFRHLYFRKSEVRSVLNDKCYSSVQCSLFFSLHACFSAIINSVFNISFHDFIQHRVKWSHLKFSKKNSNIQQLKSIPLRPILPALELFQLNLNSISSNLTVQIGRSVLYHIIN